MKEHRTSTNYEPPRIEVLEMTVEEVIATSIYDHDGNIIIDGNTEEDWG